MNDYPDKITDDNVNDVIKSIANKNASLIISGNVNELLEATCLLNPVRRKDGTYRFFNSKYHDCCNNCKGAGKVGFWFTKKPCSNCDGVGWYENILRHSKNYE